MVRQETRLFTSDEKEFETLQAAEAHEAVLSLAAALEEEFGYFRTHSKPIAEWLLDHYTVEPKEGEKK